MGYIKVTFQINPEGKYFVSECVELGVASCGDTRDEALANIAEATESYLDTLVELGECEQVLRDKGIIVRSDRFPDVKPPIAFPPDPYPRDIVVQLPVGACA